MLQLRNDSAAEDVVSETMLAILEKPDNFEGRSSLRTYATGVLKFKIIDVIRKRGREVHIEPLDEQSMDDAMDALFAKDGHWAEPPPAWQEPDKALQQSARLRGDVAVDLRRARPNVAARRAGPHAAAFRHLRHLSQCRRAVRFPAPCDAPAGREPASR